MNDEDDEIEQLFKIYFILLKHFKVDDEEMLSGLKQFSEEEPELREYILERYKKYKRDMKDE